MTPRKIYISNEVLNKVASDWECADIYIAPVQDILKTEVTTPYILETEHLKTIESWKEEEKLWIQQLAEKDAEIERLKETQFEWISTNDKMPKGDCHCLCSVIEIDKWGDEFKRQYILSYFMNAFVTPNDKIIKVTHWVILSDNP